MKQSGIIYYHDWNYTPSSGSAKHPHRKSASKHAHNAPHHTNTFSLLVGLGMVALAVGGMVGPLTPRIRLEAQYAWLQAGSAVHSYIQTIGTNHAPIATKQVPEAKPAVFSPLKTPDGATIDPINKEFSLVVPKIGINAAVIPAVNPNKPGEYLAALQQGVAHSSLSYFPDEDGTVYLFSHSTNSDWFVKDMNAVFYLLKNLEEKDDIVIFYKGSAYTYRITGKQIVKPTDVSYMAPQAGEKKLILQTCWPPGSTTERLLIFADLVKEENIAI